MHIFLMNFTTFRIFCRIAIRHPVILLMLFILLLMLIDKWIMLVKMLAMLLTSLQDSS